MRLLLDACVWGGAADALRMSGHDVVWSGDWNEDPGDEEILATAYAEGRILITLDKDFVSWPWSGEALIAAYSALRDSRRDDRRQSSRSS